MRCLGFYRITAALAFALAVTPVSVAANECGQGSPQPADESVTAAVLDPSLRSSLAVQTFQAAAEVADARKQLTAKLGFPLFAGWTGEAGFNAAFDHDVAAARPTSLRRLTDASSFWGAAGWVRPKDTRHVAPVLGARVEISRDEFDYYDMGLASHTDMHPAFAATATAGVVLRHRALVAMNYRWLQAWHIDDGRRACGAQAGGVVCPVDRLFRPPSPEPRQQLEMQAQGSIGDKVGASVFVTRDFRDDVWGFEAPVYFISRTDSGFTGGVVVTYNGYSDRFDWSLFVGQVFRLFK